MEIVRLHSIDERKQAAELFGVAIRRHWRSVTKETAMSWVQDEFLYSESFVFAVVRDGRLQAVLCGCPLMYVSVPIEERWSVARVLGVSGDPPCLSSIVHLGGLAVAKASEHRKLVRPLHEAVLAEARGRRYCYVVGQTYLPTPQRPRYTHHWTRLQRVGWRVLPEASSLRTLEGVPVTWVTLPIS